MIIIGSDHAGIELKNKIIEFLYNKKIEYIDVSKDNNIKNDDYPDTSRKICKKVLEKSINLGVAICGTGIGMSISANKVNGIRAAICTDKYMAEMARKHNNANILCLGARIESVSKGNRALEIVDTFINTFYEGGRHDARLEKIKDIEKNNI